jgi:hypothetical protein
LDGSVCPLSLFGARRFGRDNVYMRASAWVIPYTKSLVVVVPFWIFDRDGIVFPYSSCLVRFHVLPGQAGSSISDIAGRHWYMRQCMGTILCSLLG